MEKHEKIYLAGHAGLVGGAIFRKLEGEGFSNIVTRKYSELDLTDQQNTERFFAEEKPTYVFLAAAKVGGILANKGHKAEFIYENLQIQNNVIHNAWKHGVKKLLFLGSACVYPKECPQPIKEEYFMTGPPEATNDAYAYAKIAGIKMCQSYNEQYGTNFISVMPTNVYGPGDNFELETSHVIPALLRRFHEAKERGDASITLWGSGKPRREFIYVDDLAAACLFLMDVYNKGDIINVGTGKDVSIAELAEIVRGLVGFSGRIEWDTSKPDGMYKRHLDISCLSVLGWAPATSLKEGLLETYDWFVHNVA